MRSTAGPAAASRRLGRRSPEVVALLAVLSMPACSVAPVKRTEVDQQLPDRVAPIVVGETSRAQVRDLLGAPQVTSEYWRFDLFRLSGANITVGLLYVVPFSVTQDVDALALVAYDSGGKVEGFDKGSTRAVPAWGEHDPPLKIESGDVTAISQVGRTTSLYVSPARRDTFLGADKSRSRCTVVVACDGGSQCRSTWTIDGKAQAPLTWIPPEVATTRSSPKPPPHPLRAWLTPLEIAPGQHELRVLDKRDVVSSEALNCAAGELVFVLVDRPIQVLPAMPVAFSALPMLIYRDGWLVSSEPGRE